MVCSVENRMGFLAWRSRVRVLCVSITHVIWKFQFLKCWAFCFFAIHTHALDSHTSLGSLERTREKINDRSSCRMLSRVEDDPCAREASMITSRKSMSHFLIRARANKFGIFDLHSPYSLAKIFADFCDFSTVSKASFGYFKPYIYSLFVPHIICTA